MNDLPLRAHIHFSECELFDEDDQAKDINYADFVRCSNCDKYGYVELGLNLCPNCGMDGSMMDIQYGEVKETE